MSVYSYKVRMPDIKPTLIEKLVLIRKRRRWTADTAAKRWKLNPHTLRAYERGERQPGRFTLLYLEKIIAAEESGRRFRAPTVLLD